MSIKWDINNLGRFPNSSLEFAVTFILSMMLLTTFLSTLATKPNKLDRLSMANLSSQFKAAI
jgi:hypothetical protein